jgi:hypothetical protein
VDPSSQARYGTNVGEIFGQVILSLTAGDVITIVNSQSTSGTVTLSADTGGTQLSVNASVVITRIA